MDLLVSSILTSAHSHETKTLNILKVFDQIPAENRLQEFLLVMQKLHARISLQPLEINEEPGCN
jgi:hypothetical protein